MCKHVVFIIAVGDSHAYSLVDDLALGPEIDILEGIPYPFGDGGGFVDVCSGKNNGELVSSKPGSPIGFLPDILADHMGGLYQHKIPFEMLVGIVVGLKVVDIDHDQRQSASPLLCRSYFFGKVLIEIPAV